ncbi:hypothetical protein Salat_2897000 [Sesamum alatum]|uniref:Uncharacterized protein n=1 Tax=Sesamum alatum TaxID=300844 RepID=A0AAE1XJE4_9LAMI|nr:hypothetical protein Salat_2897000 [Sesamum alatum]
MVIILCLPEGTSHFSTSDWRLYELKNQNYNSNKSPFLTSLRTLLQKQRSPSCRFIVGVAPLLVRSATSSPLLCRHRPDSPRLCRRSTNSSFRKGVVLISLFSRVCVLCEEESDET